MGILLGMITLATSCGLMRKPNTMSDLFSAHDLKETLMLSDDQANLIKQINEGYLNERKPLETKLLDLEQSIQAESWAEDTEVEKLKGLLTKAAEVEVALQILAVQRRIAVEEQLADDQKLRLRSLVRQNFLLEKRNGNAIR